MGQTSGLPVPGAFGSVDASSHAMKRRNYIVYGMLAAIWLILVGWQIVEHARVEASTRAVLRNRAKDISNTLFLLMRSQRFFGVINKERLESALNELVSPGELHSVVLLNSMNEVVASAGKPMELPSLKEFQNGELWKDDSVTLINLVDLGTNVTRDLTNLSIVMPVRELFASFPSNRPPPRRTNDFDHEHGAHPPDSAQGQLRRFDSDMRLPPSEPPFNESPDLRLRRHPEGWRRGSATNDLNYFIRPPWMKEQEYQTIIAKKGVHGLLLTLSTQSLQPILREDLLVRLVIGLLGAIAVLGTSLTWKSLAKTSELQIRLVRAREQNLHLQQMNLAAAGLAHETRNPLSIIRGLAQLISKEQSASPDIRTRSRDIIDETDRVTAQLNEFINYSRPREVRPAATDLKALIAEVAHALNYDVEEKRVRLQLLAEPLTIQADEPLLRQALFNLVLNAVQAVDIGGEIQIRARKENNSEIAIEICDNGPGVAPENLEEIFKPYFTTHKKGTGLGLAVVKQIISAHGWEIECLPNSPTGAIFRILHVKGTAKN